MSLVYGRVRLLSRLLVPYRISAIHRCQHSDAVDLQKPGSNDNRSSILNNVQKELLDIINEKRRMKNLEVPDYNDLPQVVQDLNTIDESLHVAIEHEIRHLGKHAVIKRDYERALRYNFDGTETLSSLAAKFPFLIKKAHYKIPILKRMIESVKLLSKVDSITNIDYRHLISPEGIRQRITMIEEVGIVMNLKSLHKIEQYQMLSERELKQMKLIPEKSNALDTMLNHIEDAQIRKEVKSRLSTINNNSLITIKLLKNKLINEYISVKTGLPTEELPFDIIQGIRSYYLIPDCIKIIDMVTADPDGKDNWKKIEWDVLVRCADIGTIEEAMRRKEIMGKHVTTYFNQAFITGMFHQSLSHFDDKIKFLKDLGFPDKQINHHITRIASMRIETLRERIQFWFNVFSPEQLIYNDHGLHLVTEYRIAVYNLKNTLLSKHNTSASSNMELTNNAIRSLVKSPHAKARRQGTSTKMLRKVLREFVGKYGLDMDKFIENISKSERTLHIEERNAEAVADFLLSKDASREQFITSPYIFMYNNYYVKKIFASHGSVLAEWTTHPLFLDYVVYLLEHEFRFTGVLDS